MLTAACHCTDCQRMTAGPYSLSALYPEAKFKLLGGKPIVGDCRSAGQHYFCESCYIWAYTRPGSIEGVVNVRTPLLERANDFPPFAEFFRDEALAGIQSGAVLTFESAPAPDDFLKLTDDYAAWEKCPA